MIGAIFVLLNPGAVMRAIAIDHHEFDFWAQKGFNKDDKKRWVLRLEFWDCGNCVSFIVLFNHIISNITNLFPTFDHCHFYAKTYILMQDDNRRKYNTFLKII